MHTVSRNLRRLWRHLTRSQARIGWILVLAGVAVYGLYPQTWVGEDPVRQFALIMASVAAGAIFLPEISSNLWTIDATDVNRLIPDSQVSQLQESLVRAQIAEPAWADRVLDSALRPLLAVSKAPHKVLGNFAYEANIHTDVQVRVLGEARVMHRVEASLRAARVLPRGTGDGVYWISVARTDAALEAEFGQDPCLFREVVDVDAGWSDEEWTKAVRELCGARIVVDGFTLEATKEPPAGTSVVPPPAGVVRWYFALGEAASPSSGSERRTMTLALDYPMVRNAIEVMFGSYYVMGGAEAKVRLYDATNRFRIEHKAFLGRALGSGQVKVDVIPKPGLCTEVSMASGDGCLLWPGSGIYVFWGERQPVGAESYVDSASG